MNVKKYIKFALLTANLLLLPVCNSIVKADGNRDVDPLKYLRDNYPKLTNEYENELLNFPVHYIFAVDVSWSMLKYAGQVDSALVPFIKALPDNDYVTFIRFGTESKDNEVGYNAKINANTKNTLINNLHTLYTNQNDSGNKEFRMHTDIFKAVKSIADVEKRRQEAKQNVVVIITDFRHEPADGRERRFTDEEISQMNRMIEAANIGKESRNVALKLKVDESKPGYCLDQLKDQVFPTEGKAAMQIVPVGNDPGAINSWFEQLRRDIMVNKLATIIEVENRAIDIDFDQEVNIDGDVKTEIRWKPTRLYKKMRVDSSVVAEPRKSGFYFSVNSEELGEKKELELKAELGQLKHSGFGFLGFHHMTDSLQLGVDMPTDFDDELRKLEIQKPISTPKNKIDKWIFTLPIPFWLAATIVALILLYIILVIRQIKRNSSSLGCFKGEIAVKDPEGDSEPIKDRINKYVNSISVGKSGTGKFHLSGATWSFSVKKVTSSPLVPFRDPKLVFAVESGFVCSKTYPRGVAGKTCSGVQTLSCGARKGDKTHTVIIKVIK